jgi:hypothetical protein
LRRHYSGYLHGLPGARELRAQLCAAESEDEIEELLEDYELEQVRSSSWSDWTTAPAGLLEPGLLCQ